MTDTLTFITYAAWTALAAQIRVYLMWRAHEKARR